jgi:DNA-binding response OmpR family regulator
VIASVTAIHPRKLREYGVAGYLPKPFPLDALVGTIDRLVNRAADEGRDPSRRAEGSAVEES